MILFVAVELIDFTSAGMAHPIMIVGYLVTTATLLQHVGIVAVQAWWMGK